MHTTKTLAVIILNWNGLDLLKRLLPIASRYTRGEEVDLIVADNGSTDGSCEWIAENHPEVKIMAFDKNYGFSEGYNRALRLTQYPYTVLLNSDVEVTDGWWQPLLGFMKANKEVAAVQPKIMSYKNRDEFEYAGAAGGYLDRLGYPYCRGRLFDRVEKDFGQYDGSAADVAWASGAALMVRTSIYLRLGGLDPRFFAHMEEIDFCCRLHAAGYRVCAVPDSKVYHMGGASLPKDNPKKVYLNFRNNLLLLHKNLPRRKGRRVLVVRRLVDTLAWLMYVVKGDFADAKAIFQAHSDFRKMRKFYTDFPATDRLCNLPGANRWIVADRYLFNKKV